MEPTSTSSSAASSIDGRSVGGGGNDGGFLNLGMFSGSGISAGQSNTTNQQQQHQQLQQLQQQQHQLQAGDLLTSGSSGGGYSLANGFGNIVLDSSIGTSGSMTSFDLSDFPSLVGGGGNSAIGGSIPGAGSGLAAALRAQQQQQQQLIQQNNASNNGSKIAGGGGGNLYRLAMASTNGNFNMASEDFPALSGSSAQSGSSGLGSNSILNSSSLLSGTSNTSVQRTNANGDALYNGSILDNTSSQLESGAGLLSGAGLSSLGGLRGLQQSSVNQNVPISRAPTSSTGAGAIGSSVMLVNSSGATTGSALSGDYGLLGLLSVIRMTDADRNVLALGSDLTLLGLNLGTTEQIYSTFSSPWTDGVATKEPHFQLPACYYMPTPVLKTGHLSTFKLETLFYIFYALPKDVLQAYAAQELYSREWRYHGELKLWFKRAGPSDVIGANSSVSRTPPQYLYFDINAWERRMFNGAMNQNITNGFLPDVDVRVKL